MAYYRDNSGQHSDDDLYSDVFAEFDFGSIDYGCNFFCPECRDMLRCDAFSEVKEAWESFYM